jgi:serine/tyrosine/threonine adenylyltransferase
MPPATSTPQASHGWNFHHSYATLPAALHTACSPSPSPSPQTIVVNHSLALDLGLDPATLSNPPAASILTGTTLPPGARPIAQAYAGHQFGHFTMLGDGRAHLLGEQITPSGQRFDIQLKGAGQTPYSRRGDGRAALGPMLREYIVAEAMHALGIPTTRSLAVATTGATVYRRSPLPGAVLTRIAASHIRVGTFEYAAALGDTAILRQLADHTLHRHFPDAATSPEPYLALLQNTADRQAALVARWLLVGFIHGVMNTDNMALSGETIDYGPCAFLDSYDPATVFSSIDQNGRYAYANQPPIAQWNLTRLAEALLPLIHPDPQVAAPLAEKALDSFPATFQAHWLEGMRAKLGLLTEAPEDHDLAKDFLAILQANKADFTNSFRQLDPTSPPDPSGPLGRAFPLWHARWTARLAAQPGSIADAIRTMHAHNPARIPRNHKVEQALSAAEQDADLAPLHALLSALAQPYQDDPAHAAYTLPPQPHEIVRETFCGT